MIPDKNRILVFPKGTIVNFDGIPCELLQDTPYESEHFRNATLRKEESVKKNDVKTSFFKKLFCSHENKLFVRGLDGDRTNTTIFDGLFSKNYARREFKCPDCGKIVYEPVFLHG